MRKVFKAVAFQLIGNPLRVRRALSKMASTGQISILSLHRIGPHDGSAYPPLSSELLSDIIQFCLRNGDVLTFSDLAERRSGHPTFVLSFDDGYLDFAEHALPILQRLGVRCNHNFIPSCVDSGRPPLNVFIQDFIGKAPIELAEKLCLHLTGEANLTGGREAAGNRLSSFLKNRPMAEQERLVESVSHIIHQFVGFKHTPMMTAADIANLGDKVEVGAHSFEHASLAFETNDYVRADARKCRSWFRNRLGREMTIYALPNGSGTDEQIAILQQEGYPVVLRVGERLSTQRSDIHTRITIYGDSRNEIRSRSLGLVPA